MRIPLSWLAEYVELPAGITPEQVHADLVKVGFEEEDLHSFEVSGPIVVGEVLEFTPEEQSNGKTINWCQVRVAPAGKKAADGGEDVRGIVCGAHNFVVGDNVVVCLPGAVLPGPFPIAARKTYGHTSDGMLASAKELGLGDDHTGIMRLNTLFDAEKLEIGADAAALLHLDDSAVEINVTPDRGYAFSIRGIAREYAHSTGATFRDPASVYSSLAQHAFDHEFSVTITDDAPIRGRLGASVFVTRIVKGVDGTRPTPAWMVSRLRLAGIRSISLLVDITNYVMLELGQPIHGYDLDKLQGGITVRRAKAGKDGKASKSSEKLTTLDGVERPLHPEDLLICDASGPIGLAGVMGGATTEIDENTTNVLVEAANFDPVSIARTARRHKLPSEASKRFERGVDPNVASIAAARVVQLLVDLAGGTAENAGSHHAEHAAPNAIELPATFVSELMGYDYTDAQIQGTLAEIGGTVEKTKLANKQDGYLVTPPSWRPDLTDKWTLAEEVARIIGYDVIPATLPVAPPGRGYTTAQQLRRRVSDALAATGHTEVLSYPFFDAFTNNLFGSATAAEVPQVKLANALDDSQGWMRTSLLPGLMQTAARNKARGFTDLAIFEQGLVFLPEAKKKYAHDMLPAAQKPTAEQLKAIEAAIPPQPRHLAAVFTGDAIEREPGQKAVSVDWQDALTAVQQIALAAGVEITVRQGMHKSFHPGRCAELFAGEQLIGFAGEILPPVAAEFNLAGRVAALEIDLDALAHHAGNPVDAKPIHAMTAATQDLSLVVADNIPAEDVRRAVFAGAGDLLENIHLTDVYAGQGIADGHRSLTFALRFRAADRTLTQAEATEAKDAGVAEAAERYYATMRE